MADRSFYRDKPPELLSQGDIAIDIPWGLIEAPTTLCRPIDRKQPNGKARYSCVDPWVMQGSPVPWSRDPEIIHAVGWQAPAMVLWHDCQIEKADNQERDRPEKAFAAIAPIHSLSALQSDTPEKTKDVQDKVRNLRHKSYFYLPAVTAGDFAIQESFVNLRYIWSIRQQTLANRPVSLHPEILMSLYSTLFLFFTRFRLDADPACPKCGSLVPLIQEPEDQEETL